MASALTTATLATRKGDAISMKPRPQSVGAFPLVARDSVSGIRSHPFLPCSPVEATGRRVIAEWPRPGRRCWRFSDGEPASTLLLRWITVLRTELATGPAGEPLVTGSGGRGSEKAGRPQS